MRIGAANSAIPAEPPGAVIVRSVAQTDLTALAHLLRAEAEFARQIAGDFRLQDDFDWVGYAATRIDHASRKLFVAERVDRLIGYIDISTRLIPASAARKSRNFRWSPVAWLTRRTRKPLVTPLVAMRRGRIDGCYVVQSERGNGIGALLVEHAKGWFQGNGVTRIELGVFANNPAAIFWKRLGFHDYRITMCADLDSVSAQTDE